ncbi:MAG: hypothetical protein ACJ762_09000 [Solirubrobacteraceae bacterium]
MRSLSSPSRGNAALALSIVAVFASMGGPGWAASAISGKNLKNRSVTGKKLALGAVSNSRLASNAVTGAKIKNGAVGSVDVADGSLARADASPDFFTGLQTALTTGSIFTALLADNAVTTAKIGNGQVTGVKIDPGAVSTTRLLNNAVTSVKIEDGTVAAGDLADSAVTSAKIADGAIATGDIAANGVTAGDFDVAGNAPVDFPSVPDGACVPAPVNVTGVDLTNDAIVLTPGPGYPLSTATAVVQSATSFSIVACNLTGAPVDAPAVNFRWVAIDA